MSKVIESIERQQGGCKAVGTVVLHGNGKYFLVDTANTPDHGPETMVFSYDKKTETVTKWSDLYAEWYGSMNDALLKHEEIIANLEKYL